MLEHGDDFELHALLGETVVLSPQKYPYRGYCLLNTTDALIGSQVCFFEHMNKNQELVER